MVDTDDIHYFGTPLPEFRSANLPVKQQSPHVDAQVVRDENGLRRFHGAFTGGYSAGYWNTVGSQNGWQPQEFKSSRHEKASWQAQRPEQFMDAEDLGEFGIAPQRLKIQNEFVQGSFDKRAKRELGNLESLLVEQLTIPSHGKISLHILNKMGWRRGRGVGPLQSRKQKKKTEMHNKHENYLIEHYGFKPKIKMPSLDDDDSPIDMADNDDDTAILFAPDEYEAFVVAVKDDRFGLGYSGVRRDSRIENSVGHVSFFETMKVLNEKKETQFRKSGQAFGVGALEEEDADIYACDNLSSYDFSLEVKNDYQDTKKVLIVQDPHVVDGFITSKKSTQCLRALYKIDIPSGWRACNSIQRKSRFSPINGKVYTILADPMVNHNSLTCQSSLSTQHLAANFEDFDNDTKTDDNGESNIKTNLSSEGFQHQNPVNNLASDRKEKDEPFGLKSGSDGFKPFAADKPKQLRYEQFLKAELGSEADIRKFLKNIQPMHMLEWNCEMEVKEFIQARSIYKPLAGIMSERFVSETGGNELLKIRTSKPENVVNLVRIKSLWKPAALLCKHYNIEEPVSGYMDDSKEKPCAKKSIFSIYDYMEKSLNSKSKFMTPVIIPERKHPMTLLVKNSNTEAHAIVRSRTPANTRNIKSVEEQETKIISNRKLLLLPVTELEKQSNDTQDRLPCQKRDLFKTIFESDGESDEGEKPKFSNEKQKSIFSTTTANSSKTLNLLHSNSAPRNLFSVLFHRPADKPLKNCNSPENDEQIDSGKKTSMEAFEQLPKLTYMSREIRKNIEQKNQADKQIYGPTQHAHKSCTQMEGNLLSPQTGTQSSSDEWVEKDVLISSYSKQIPNTSCQRLDDLNKKEPKKRKKVSRHKKNKKNKHN